MHTMTTPVRQWVGDVMCTVSCPRVLIGKPAVGGLGGVIGGGAGEGWAPGGSVPLKLTARHIYIVYMKYRGKTMVTPKHF